MKKRKEGGGGARGEGPKRRRDGATGTLGWLLGCESAEELAEFREKVWERGFKHVRRGDPSFYGELFTLGGLLERLRGSGGGEDEEVRFGTHLNAVRFENGRKRSLNPGEGPASAEQVEALVREELATLQFHQPQRHSEELHRLLGALEAEVGCLVGANVYVTPPGAQGLAPHHDDIEAFVLQLEGEKEWELYEPLAELPTSSSADLDASSIGEPCARVTLRAGDLLYFPRGQVHCARVPAGAAGVSTHLTVSTYQAFSWSHFLAEALPRAVAAAAERPEMVALRRGLPLGFFRDTNAFAREGAREAVRARMRALLASPEVLDALVDGMENAADHFAVDFISSRLPPLGLASPPPAEALAATDPSTRVRLVDPDVVRLVRTTAEEVGAGDETVTLFHCLNNVREGHMLSAPPLESDGEEEEEDEEEEEEEEEGQHGQPDGAIVFPVFYYPALARLFAAFPRAVAIVDLAGPDDDGDEEGEEEDGQGKTDLNVAECLHLAQSLAAEGIVVVE